MCPVKLVGEIPSYLYYFVCNIGHSLTYCEEVQVVHGYHSKVVFGTLRYIII